MDINLDSKYIGYKNFLINVSEDFIDAFNEMFDNEILYVDVDNNFYGNNDAYIRFQCYLRKEIDVDKFTESKLNWKIHHIYTGLHCRETSGYTNNINFLINIKNLDNLVALYRYPKIKKLMSNINEKRNN